MSALTDLDKESPIPLYRQLELRVIEDLKAGQYRPGEFFPTEHELCERYGVSRITVRQTLAELVRGGYLYRPNARQRLRVRPRRVSHKLARLEGFFTDDLLAQGAHPCTRLIELSLARNAAQAQAFGLAPDVQFHRVERLHEADGEPMAFQVSFLPETVIAEMRGEDLTGSILSLIEERTGSTVSHARQRVRVRPASAAEQRWLQLPRYASVISLERMSFEAAGRAVEHFEAGLHLERYDLVMDVMRSEPSDPPVNGPSCGP